MTTKFRVLDREEFIMRAAYDLDGAQERSTKKVMEKPAKPSLANRVTLFNHLLAEGANPDEAAQGAGWKNLNTARACCSKGGIKLSTKASTVNAAPPRKAAVINQEFDEAFKKPPTPGPVFANGAPKPVTVNETVSVANETPVFAKDPRPSPDKPTKACTLRPFCWYGKNFIYTDNGDYIDIQPREGNEFQFTREDLKQFSEELKELLEIIK